jgi:hypothetical protein
MWKKNHHEVHEEHEETFNTDLAISVQNRLNKWTGFTVLRIAAVVR